MTYDEIFEKALRQEFSYGLPEPYSTMWSTIDPTDFDAVQRIQEKIVDDSALCSEARVALGSLLQERHLRSVYNKSVESINS